MYGPQLSVQKRRRNIHERPVFCPEEDHLTPACFPKLGQRRRVAFIKIVREDIAVLVHDAEVPHVTVAGRSLVQGIVQSKPIFQQHRFDDLPCESLHEAPPPLREALFDGRRNGIGQVHAHGNEQYEQGDYPDNRRKPIEGPAIQGHDKSPLSRTRSYSSTAD